ncbi:MAG: hypothetical protein JWN45_1530 [Acidobacteriaceae bacterium]|nr:hypothetical protein [Acidobacteriaceae bacterium]
MKQIRQLHLYLGTFFAPSILFFAFTGAFQIFNFHEEYKGRPATPVFEQLAEIHKNQRVPPPAKTPAPTPEVARAATTPQEPTQPSPAQPKAESAMGENKEAAPPKPATTPAAPKRRKRSEPLKYFLVLMAISLISTTFLGIYMSFKYNRDKRVVWGLLILGTVLPIVLLYL